MEIELEQIQNMRRRSPMVFTQRVRSFYAFDSNADSKVNKLEHEVTQVFKVVFERLENLEENIPSHSGDRKRIGPKNKRRIAV